MVRHRIRLLWRSRAGSTALVLLCASVVVAASACPAGAQDFRYRPPAGPTISPTFDFFRGDIQMLDFYSGIVRPNAQLRAAVVRQGTLLNQQRSQLGRMEGQIQQIRRSEMAPTGSGVRFFNELAPTGSGGRFFNFESTGGRKDRFYNFSHYYPARVGYSRGGGGGVRPLYAAGELPNPRRYSSDR